MTVSIWLPNKGPGSALTPEPMKKKTGIQNGSRNPSRLLHTGLSPWHPATKNLRLVLTNKPGLLAYLVILFLCLEDPPLWKLTCKQQHQRPTTSLAHLFLLKMQKREVTQCGRHWSKPQVCGHFPAPSTPSLWPVLPVSLSRDWFGGITKNSLHQSIAQTDVFLLPSLSPESCFSVCST